MVCGLMTLTDFYTHIVWLGELLLYALLIRGRSDVFYSQFRPDEFNCLCMYLHSNSAKIEVIYLVKNHKAVKGTNQHKLLNNYPYLG